MSAKGGSKKHGGPDLGPTRARQAWVELGIDGRGVATEAPEQGFDGMPRLTPRMLARLQGFPDGWTNIPWRGRPAPDRLRYRALGNAMCVNVMRWLGERITRYGHA